MLFTLVLNTLGLLASINNVNAATTDTRPKMTGVEMVEKSPAAGVYPTLRLSSTGCAAVQYSVYLYSPTKKIWENVSGGYTTSVAGNGTYTLKLTKPLHSGENSFSVWVKKSGSTPINSGGYDDFQSYRVTVNASSTSEIIPEIKSASILSTEQKAGIYPSLRVTSTGDTKVQYRVYLYSPVSKIWEDVTGGYTAPVDSASTTSLKLNKPLHEGENSFSVWVKRADRDPINKAGYDNFLSYRVSVGTSDNTEGEALLPTVKSATISATQQKVGIKPIISLTSTGSENVQYRVYLYSPTKKIWEDVSGGYTGAVSPSSTYNLQSNIALHEGENSFSIWVKRAGKVPANSAGYDNFLSYRINAGTSDNTEGEALLPTVKSATISATQQKVGIKPIISLTSTGSENVQYRVFLYSSTKKIWEDISNGYTEAVNPSSIYNLQSNIALQKGESSFSIWVKRAGKTPVNKEGYDNFLSYRINVTSESNTIPEITSVNVDSSGIKLGGYPGVTLKSSADVNVQYRIYLYSQSKGIWEDVSNGYTESVDPSTPTTVKITKPLQPGSNTFSIWVKRAGYSPIDPGGYDSYVHDISNVTVNADKTPKISEATVNSAKVNEGTIPELTVSASAGDGSNISYKAFMFSNSKGQWVSSSEYTDPIKSGEKTTISLSTPLESGTNKVLLWAKRAWISGEVYEDYKIVNIDAIRPAPLKKKIIVDPGHGGKDPGALSASGTRERDIALSVGLKLGSILQSTGYEVLYTRTQNDVVSWNSLVQSESLAYRTNFANSNGADLFVSIHCNAGGGTGTETFYSKNYVSKDQALATSIQQELVASIGLYNRGAKPGSLYVLNNTKMPASLVELAFIDTLSDEAKLKDPVFQQKAANGIANGIAKYWNR
ncbi:N-acetylmuramoyl-L-alanine amidase family protein [Clostridium cylindrosporum]|uniref:Sporulation-specific N-acetylmuramoyl-L-alanine amidase CwlC n=1 Tax=Clostridium cylindrosporum DSM 605 TaxID=1121307 RepID=A0A0J8G6A6_CLOCY|nr:N-acetylmuramoyl-L-alanine amidase [Clostridium cylindrosporum]KMT23141.1 sporulation-specific N-acetylmuramoyl-L-alanine amidase CwlC [Clostridium cylindrosporum DSM 605]